jgi:hypothetical protein
MTGGEQHQRAVRVQTVHGSLRGSLRLAAQLRTLDDLNVVAKSFVTLHDVEATEVFSFSEGSISVNKSLILFVGEIATRQTQAGGQFGRFSRASIQLKVGPFDVQGFVHVPAGGVVMKRLDQSSHPFIALTSALVVGPDVEFTAPFLAVNRNQVVAAQELQPAAATAAVPEAASRFES